MDQKIAELTEKIFKEGIEKAQVKADEVLKEAESRRDVILSDARKEAQRMVSEAEKSAAELRKNVESEVKLAGQQAISAIRQQILDVITARTSGEPVRAVLSDPEVIKQIVTTVAQRWGQASGEGASLELLLPVDKQKELEAALRGGVLSGLSKGMDLKFVREVKGGFQIKPKDGSFKISMTDEDFVEFFKEFVRPRTRALLFG